MANEVNDDALRKMLSDAKYAAEFDAIVDAIRFVEASPEMPSPTIHIGNFEGKPYIVLNWQDRKRLVWTRASFDGSGVFGWLNLCPPEQFEEPPTEDYKNVPADRGAPATLVSRIDFVTREAA